MWFIKWFIKFHLCLIAITCVGAGCIAGLAWLFQDNTVEKKYMRVKVGETYITLDEDTAALKAIDDAIQRQKDAKWANIDDKYKYRDEDGNWHFRIPEEYYKKIEERKIKEREKMKRSLPVFTEEDLVRFEYELERQDAIDEERGY